MCIVFIVYGLTFKYYVCFCFLRSFAKFQCQSFTSIQLRQKHERKKSREKKHQWNQIKYKHCIHTVTVLHETQRPIAPGTSLIFTINDKYIYTPAKYTNTYSTSYIHIPYYWSNAIANKCIYFKFAELAVNLMKSVVFFYFFLFFVSFLLFWFLAVAVCYFFGFSVLISFLFVFVLLLFYGRQRQCSRKKVAIYLPTRTKQFNKYTYTYIQVQRTIYTLFVLFGQLFVCRLFKFLYVHTVSFLYLLNNTIAPSKYHAMNNKKTEPTMKFTNISNTQVEVTPARWYLISRYWRKSVSRSIRI